MESDVLLEGKVWKRTLIADYVVQRHTRLYKDRFVTFSERHDRDDQKEWVLEDDARIHPAVKEDIQKKRRRIRPSGMFYTTQLISSKGDPIELYTFRVETSSGWSDSFTFGLETLEQAYKWHDAISAVLAANRQKAGLPEQGLTPWGSLRMSQVPVSSSAEASGAPASPGGTTAPSSEAEAGPSEELTSDIWNFQLGTRSNSCRRWIPFKHSNGVAIYQHHLASEGKHRGAGEYMVSAVVNGAPVELLRELLDPGSSTSILGPASEVEVLESEHGRQVVRIRVEASGYVGQVFRPRETVVQRTLKEEEKGVYVLLFSSINTYSAMDASWEGVIEEAEGLSPRARRANPVHFRVKGCYTISRLDGSKTGSDSKEALITCVMQVEDMGGWLNHRHPLFPFIDWFYGAYDAFVERMLMAVILVKDAVEQSRFAVRPATLRWAGEDREQQQPAEGSRRGYAPSRSSSFFMHRAADAWLQSSEKGASISGGRSSSGGLGPGCRVSRLASTRAGPPQVESTGGAGGPLGVLEEGLELSEGAAVDGAAAAVAAVKEPIFHLDRKFYEEIHTFGKDDPFKVRGPGYLQDGRKVPAGCPMFELQGIELYETQGSVNHISRYMATVRSSPKAFLFVFNMIVPGPPTLSVAMVWGTDQHPDTLGPPPEDPDEGDWEPFDYLLWRFLHGSNEDRTSLFKMIPHIAEGSWVIKQSVGSTPVILARKLGTQFFVTPKYVEVSVDVGSSATARHVTGMVRGATRSLVIDLGLVLEGIHPYELPEVLIGACRVHKLDLGVAIKLDTSRELPLPSTS